MNVTSFRFCSTFDVVAVVTKPPALGKHKSINLTPVHKMAKEFNIKVFTPDKASENDFISAIEDIQPDICLTAAYGNYLPTKFLAIPKFGTLYVRTDTMTIVLRCNLYNLFIEIYIPAFFPNIVEHLQFSAP